jgi:hypothetical protein
MAEAAAQTTAQRQANTGLSSRSAMLPFDRDPALLLEYADQ